MNEYINGELLESTYLFCVKRISNSEDAKDLTQDILYEALRAVSAGKQFVSFYSWYWKMARNKYADYIRHKRSPYSPIEEAGGIAADTPHLLEKLITEEEISALNYSLSRLQKNYREIMILFYLRNRSVNDIAGILKIPAGTVKSRLFDARKQLKERFDNMSNIGKSAYAPALAEWSWGYSASKAARLMNSSKIIPQVMVICRTEPKSVNDIADEMAVAPVYLEEFLTKMTEENLLISPAKGKYLANCCVFPERVYMETVLYASNAFHENGFPERITEKLLKLKDKITSLDFYGNDFEYPYLMWLLYAAAGDIFGTVGLKYHLEKYKGKYADENREYRLTIRYTLPDECCGESLFKKMKAVSWSCLHQNFKTSDYGSVIFENVFESKPFPNDVIYPDEWRRGRDRWIDGNNISLLLDLSKDPCKKLTKFEEEKAAEFLEKGLLKKDGGRLVVQLPIFTRETKERMFEIVREEIKDIAREYAETVGSETEKRLMRYIRKDLMSNFLYWDMRFFFQTTQSLFWYGWDKYLALPEDYSRSAAGLCLVK